MAASPARRREARDTIEMLGTLPRWPEDDVLFITKKLGEYAGRLVTITDVVRDIGLADRNADGSTPSREYMRMRAALHTAHSLGLVRRSGRLWGLP